jgi:hypothetical protein
MMVNNIAVLVLAHHNQEQLSLLINHLCTDFDVYVQIDKKAALSIDSLPKYKNVFYFKEIEVYWGDFSLVQNMLSVLKKAFVNKHTHYLIISGDDLPIKPNWEIIEFFHNNKDKIYMYSNPLPIASWGFNHGFDRLDRYWYMKIKSRQLAKILGRSGLLLQKFLGIKVKRFPLTYYAGSQWINLTHSSLEVVIEFLDNNPAYMKKLKYSRATDEIWVQSIIMNTELKDKVVNNDLRYIDWETGPEFPKKLNENDLDKLERSNALFARKFDIKKDREVIINLLNSLKD